MQTMSVKELAEQLSAALETAKRTDGAEFIRLKDGSPAWMTEVIREVHGESLPDDTTYRFIQRCADALVESELEFAQDTIAEIEPDVYTSDLTAWLAARNSHVDYLTEALDCEPKDGFSLLAIAQQTHIQEVGNALINALESIDPAA